MAAHGRAPKGRVVIPPAPWAAALLFVGAFLVNDCLATAHAEDAWTEHEILLGRLAVNEATGRVADTIAIVEARGHYSDDELREMHPRALAPVRVDGRRWIAGLDGSMARPDGWPEARVPWETVGRERWRAVLVLVRATLRGERSVCASRPSVWGSRTLDAERLRRIYARGGREVCMGTLNAFVIFGGRR